MNTDLRLAALRAELTKQSLPGLLVTLDANRRYLSGFTGDAGALVVAPTAAVLLTDFRYTEQAARQSPGFEVTRIVGDLGKALPEVLNRLKLKSLAFEADAITVSDLDALRKASPDTGFEATTGIVRQLRRRKDADELAAIREAIALTDRTCAHLMEWLRPDMSELAVAWEIEVFVRAHGGEGLAFPSIVASGPNASLPHAEPSDRRIQIGEPITIDMGARIRGYCSDLTRTFCFGEPDARFQDLYALVLRAQATAEKGVRPGMGGVDADALARNVISEAGYGSEFGHSLGHGVGLMIHEGPSLSALSKDTLACGEVVTIEPGIYLAGWGGIRIEDTVVVTQSGIEILTRSTKAPVLPLR